MHLEDDHGLTVGLQVHGSKHFVGMTARRLRAWPEDVLRAMRTGGARERVGAEGRRSRSRRGGVEAEEEEEEGQGSLAAPGGGRGGRRGRPWSGKHGERRGRLRSGEDSKGW